MSDRVGDDGRSSAGSCSSSSSVLIVEGSGITALAATATAATASVAAAATPASLTGLSEEDVAATDTLGASSVAVVSVARSPSPSPSLSLFPSSWACASCLSWTGDAVTAVDGCDEPSIVRGLSPSPSSLDPHHGAISTAAGQLRPVVPLATLFDATATAGRPR